MDPEFEKWPVEQRARWPKEKGVDLIVDYVNQWGLITPRVNEARLVLVASTL